MADGEVRVKITADASDVDKKLDGISGKAGQSFGKAGKTAKQAADAAKQSTEQASNALTKFGSAGEAASGKLASIGEKMSAAGEKARASFENMGGTFGGIGEKAASAFGSLGEKVSGLGEKGKSAFSGLGDSVKNFGTTAETKIKGIGSKISDFGKSISDAGEKSGGIFSKLGSTVGNAVSGIGDKVGGLGTKVSGAFTNLATGAKTGSDGVKNVAGGMGSALEAAGSKAAGAFGGIGTAIAAGVAAGVTAMAKLTEAAVSAYGRYEQLSGGVDTLFKDSADQVRAYADEAYKTAGMSANQYMENITGFSASLLQSLGGDTKAAADMGNMAVLDMSDNANKMGSNLSDVERAYQGFARGQFGMLDNLKLGYGGTHAEAERLVDDANKIREANGQAGDLSVDSFADVVQAIHEVQTEMGITGTTAQEAAGTIEGSIGTMQAAWENWMTGLANPNADMGKLTSELTESFINVVANVAPAVGRIIESIAQLIADGLRNGFNMAMEGLGLDFRMPEIDVGAAFGDFFAQLQEVGSVIQSTLGEAAQAAAPLVQGLVEAFQSFAEGAVPLVEGAVTVIGEFFSGLMEKIGGIGEFLSPAMEAMGEFWSTISTIVGEGMAMLGEAFGNADVSGAIEFLGATLNVLRDAFVVVTDTVTAFLEGVWNGFQAAMADPMVQDAIAALQEAFNGLMGALGALMEALSPIISFLGEILPPIFSVLGEIIGAFFGILVGVFSGIVAGVTNIITVVTEVVTAIVGFFTGTLPAAINGFFAGVQNFFNGVIGIVNGIIGAVTGAVGNVIGAIGGCISNIISTIAGAVGGIIGAAVEFFGGFVQGVQEQGANAISFVSEIPGQIIGLISGIDLFSIGANILQGFLNGLQSIWSNIQNFIGNIADWILSHKGPIHKDKRLLVPAGKAIMTGLSRGLRDAFASDVMPLVEGMADELATAFDGDVAGRLSLAGATLGVQSASTVYSVVLDGNTINDRAGIIDVSRDYLMELHRKGVM